jgi:uncharacterized protein YbbK (DUF523 family)
MIRVLVSACLLGERVRYNGNAATSANPILTRWLREGRIVPFCPEVAGGLGVPRPAAEIIGGNGQAVVDGVASVITHQGVDVTSSFVAGAGAALDAARRQNVRLAILKDGSPSCGSEWIYDGTFTGLKRDGGQGVTTTLLERNGIRVFNELHFDEAAAYLKILETDS